VEKFFDIFKKKVKFFNSVDEFMHWYNFTRPHEAFDLAKLKRQQLYITKGYPKRKL